MVRKDVAKALFLDRDGVINIDKGYIHKIEDFEFIEGIFDLCRLFQINGYKIVVVTNQSGIAKKYYTVRDFEKVTCWMIGKFNEQGLNIAKVYYCPFETSYRRKPRPGMLLDASAEFNLDLERCVLIGDKPSDILAAKNAGLKYHVLVKSNSRIDLREILLSLPVGAGLSMRA